MSNIKPTTKESSKEKTNLDYRLKVPHIIKYMGSKRELLKYLGHTINEIYNGEDICDLFAGTAVVSASLSKNANIYSNDIQAYSAVLAKTYLGDYDWKKYNNIVDEIIKLAQKHVLKVKNLYPKLIYKYDSNLSLDEFNAIELEQQELIYEDFENIDHHLYIKNYSGTYWSYEQCLWIDALWVASQNYIKEPVYNTILSSLMFAMAYNAQSTGHYAQYRDASNTASMNDIVIYRRKEILPYFKRKFVELVEWTGKNEKNVIVSSMDYRDCLDKIPRGTLVYADPPYAFVHYSRFYHALETLVRYDYPKVLFKGRYRTDRHQSPFCKKTEVEEAFRIMFQKIKLKNSKLVLSYSNRGMISLEKILTVAKEELGKKYEIYTKSIDYRHSTMGRSEDKSRDVLEILIIARPI